MPTDPQITDLARKYAQERIHNYGFSKETYEEMVEEETESVAYVLRWLSRHYLLVEKAKIIEEYRMNKAAHDSSCDMDSDYYQGRIHMLQSLFPEIAKEVE